MDASILQRQAAFDGFSPVVFEFDFEIALIRLPVPSAPDFIPVQFPVMVLMIKEVIVRVVIEGFIRERAVSFNFEDVVVFVQIVEYGADLVPVEYEFGIIPLQQLDDIEIRQGRRAKTGEGMFHSVHGVCFNSQLCLDIIGKVADLGSAPPS
jgi:hypothetical protein